MSFGNLLTNDYQKSIKEVFRFVIIFGNLLVFYFFNGLKERGRIGPPIYQNMPFEPWKFPKPSNTQEGIKYDDPLQHTSSLDMIAMILAIYVFMKQLTFGRPEIDSFNQIISLLPQEKKSTLFLLLFTVYKAVFQYFYDTIDYGGTTLLQKTSRRPWTLMAKNNPVLF